MSPSTKFLRVFAIFTLFGWLMAAVGSFFELTDPTNPAQPFGFDQFFKLIGLTMFIVTPIALILGGFSALITKK